MSKYHTNNSAIRKYKSDYYRLMAHEARENERIHHMKKRIRLLAEDERNSLAKQILLTDLLKQATQQKEELEQQPASKQRDKQLKKAEKEYKQAKARWSANEHHLNVIEVKKDKDNAAKLVLKEAKRDEVTARAQAAFDAWQKFEQLQQWEEADFKAFKAQQEDKTTTESIQTQTKAEVDIALSSIVSVPIYRERIVSQLTTRLKLVAYTCRSQQRNMPDTSYRKFQQFLPRNVIGIKSQIESPFVMQISHTTEQIQTQLDH